MTPPSFKARIDRYRSSVLSAAHGLVPHARTAVLGVSALLVSAFLSLPVGVQNAHAEGTRTLHPAGATGNRGVMDVSATGLGAGVALNRQFLYVYAREGEHILLGSSNRANGGDIRIWAEPPGGFGPKGNETVLSNASAVFTCSTYASGNTSVGTIGSRAQELAGPNSADGTGTVANGFTPCVYQVPAGGTGLYGVRFTAATSGTTSNTAPINTVQVLGSNQVAAWDITVRGADSSSLADINGRVFTYVWSVYLAANDRYLRDVELYYVSNDGYRYRQTMRNLDPNRAQFYANSQGFIDTDGSPLYRDIRANSQYVNAGPSFAAGITAQKPEYPIFFSDVTPTGTNNAEVNRVLTALAIPHAPSQPILNNPAFAGNISGNQSTVSGGGVFTFDTQNTLTYEIVISGGPVAGCLPNDFDPANPCNRVLTGIANTGSHTVLWDGLDNSGVPFPVGVHPFRIYGRNGEIHFPMLDTEGNSWGGPTLERLNAFEQDDRYTVYYDDRGYRTAGGTLIGELNGLLCGAGTGTNIVPPDPSHSLLGVDSNDGSFNGGTPGQSYYRLWTGTIDSISTDCHNVAGQYFGTNKGLNLWSLERTPEVELPIQIIPPTCEVDVGTQVSVTSSVISGGTAYGSFSFTNAGTDPATNVTYSATIGNPTIPATCPGSVNFTLLPTGVTATYSAATCEVTFAGMPGTLNQGDLLVFNFNYIVDAGNPGPIPVDTIIATTNEACDLASNSASGSTNVAKPVITYTKTSVPAPGSFVDMGDAIDYVVTVNIGNAPLTSTFTLTDTLVTGLTWGGITNSSPQFSCSGSLTCTLPAGTAIGSYTVEYTATVNSSASSTVVNNVTGSGGGGDNPPSCVGTCSTVHPLTGPADMSPEFIGLPDVMAPGQVVTGATLVCTNAGPYTAQDATCVPSVDMGAISNLVCVPNPPVDLPIGDSITCTFDYTAPGTPGGVDTPETDIEFTGTTGATNDSNPGNNTTTHEAEIIDAVDDDFSGSPIDGSTGGTTDSVLDNDTSGSDPADADTGGNVDLTPGTPSDPGLVMNPDGTITVPPMMPPGTYTYPYTICAVPATVPPTCDTGTATIVVTEEPALSILKSVTSGAGPYAEGETISYSLVVTNTGNAILTGVTVTDPNAVLGTCAPITLPGILNPSDTTTCTATHVVTAADVTAGNVHNSATATGTPPGGGGPTTTPPSEVDSPTAAPGLTIVKSVTSGPGPYAEGETISYSLVVTNTGGLTLTGVAVSDPNAVLGTCAPIILPGILNPSDTTTCTATHVVTAADVTAGNVHNSATATGTPPGGGGPTTTPPSEVDSPTAAPGLSILKSVTSGPGPYAEGETITYSLVVTNSGGLTLTGVAVSDPNAVLGTCAPIALPGILNAGDTTTCAATHVVTAADVTAGNVHNSATATGTPPGGGGPTTTPPSEVDSPTGAPGLTIVKSVTSGAGPYAEGETITYSLVVTNSGGLVMSNVTVDDPNAVLGTCAPIALPGTLNPSDTTTCTATHVVTAADVTAGTVHNSATATGTPPGGGGPTTTPPSEVDSPTGAPGLTIVKSVTSGPGPYAEGETITYSLVVTNTGGLTLTGVAVSDPNAVLGTCAPIALPGTLNAGDTTTCTATHVVTAADVTAGTVHNSATATGTPPGGGGPTTTPPSEVDSPTGAPGLTIVKSVTSGPGPYAEGETISYDLVVTNSGGLVMSNVTVDDPNAVLGTCAPIALPGTLNPSDTTTCTATHVVTAADVTAGTVHNSATATGTPPGGGGPTTTPPSEVDSPTGAPGLTIVKSVTSGPGPYAEGETISYDLVVTNSGGLVMSNVTVDDPNAVLGTCAPIALPGTLNPSDTTTCTAIHVVTAADVTAGNVHNSATATGTPPGGGGPTTTPPSEVDSPTAVPEVAVSKSADPATGASVTGGDTITYTLTAIVSNTATLSDVVLTDTLGAGLTFDAVTVPGAYAANVAGAPVLVFTLPGGTAPGTYTVQYTATVDSAATVSVGNSVTAAGGGDPADPTPTDPTCTTCSTDHPVVPAALTITKTGPAQTQVGEQVVFTLLIENNGTVPAHDVQVIDPPPFGLVWVSNAGDCVTDFPCLLGTLLPGETRVIDVTMLIPTTYTGPQKIVNTATVSSTSTASSSSSAAVLLPVVMPAWVPANAPWALWLLGLMTLLLAGAGLRRME